MTFLYGFPVTRRYAGLGSLSDIYISAGAGFRPSTVLHSPKLTASSPLKMDGLLEDDPFLVGMSSFQAINVSFREGNFNI